MPEKHRYTPIEYNGDNPEYQGVSLLVAEWAKIFGVSSVAIAKRHKHGRPIDVTCDPSQRRLEEKREQDSIPVTQFLKAQGEIFLRHGGI